MLLSNGISVDIIYAFLHYRLFSGNDDIVQGSFMQLAGLDA